MAEGVSDDLKQAAFDDSLQFEAETKEMVSGLSALGKEFRRLLDPEVIITRVSS